MQVGYSFEQDNIGFHVSNTGIGPARIEAANITYKGAPIKNWLALIDTSGITKNMEGNDNGIRTSYLSTVNKSVLPPGTRYSDIFRLEFNSLNATYKNFRKEIEKGNINISLCYCSVYDECWTTNMIHQTDDGSNKEMLYRDQQQAINCEAVTNSDI